MSALRELYQQVIIDHSKAPRNFGKIQAPDFIKEGFNPLCGDKLTVYINADQTITDLQFEGSGCAISMASASLMTEILKGKTVAEADKIFHDFHTLVTHGANDDIAARLGKLAILAGVSEYPARVKCATLAWHTLFAALHHDDKPISTE